MPSMQGRKTPVFQKYATERYIFQDGMPMTGQALKDHLNMAFKETGELIVKMEIKKK